MKKLLIVCVVSLFFGFLSGPAYAIQYCKDFLEDWNPGGWGMSPKTFDDTWLLCFIGEEIELDVWINDVPEPLIQAGFWMTYDPLFVNVVDVEVYDGIDLPGPWDPAYTVQVPDPGLGTCFVAVASLNSVPPDSDGDIIIAKVRFRGESIPGSAITVSPLPGFDTIVGVSSTVFDSGIIPNTIMLEVGFPPCNSPELNPPSVDLYPNTSQQFSMTFDCSPCYTPDWLWSDDCTQGDIDPSGLFTAGVITTEESCTACLTDQANTVFQDCSEITLQIGECEGNFDDDQDVDGSDAAKFVIDFGRSLFFDPCTNSDSCNGDFDCDVDVDGTDAAKFKEDFGRGQHENPCPCCPVDPWCMYEGDPFIKDYSDTGCLGGSSQSSFAQEGECANEDRVTAEVVGNNIIVTNSIYCNCCSAIEVELTTDGNYLHLLTMENPPGTCFCNCCIGVETEIAGLATGEYTLEMCWYDWGSGYDCETETVEVL